MSKFIGKSISFSEIMFSLLSSRVFSDIVVDDISSGLVAVVIVVVAGKDEGCMEAKLAADCAREGGSCKYNPRYVTRFLIR